MRGQQSQWLAAQPPLDRPQLSSLSPSRSAIRRISNEVCNGNSSTNYKLTFDAVHSSPLSSCEDIHMFGNSINNDFSFGCKPIDRPLSEITKQEVKGSDESLTYFANGNIMRFVKSKEDQTVMPDEELLQQLQLQQLLRQNQKMNMPIFGTTLRIMPDEEELLQQQQLLQQNQNMDMPKIMPDEKELLQQQPQQLLQQNQNMNMPVFSTTPMTADAAILMRLTDTSQVSIPFVPTANSQKRTLNFPMNVDENAEKRLRRMLKNRESAARSRARKQAYISHLEKDLEGKKRQIDELRQEKSKLEKEVKALECQYYELRKELSTFRKNFQLRLSNLDSNGHSKMTPEKLCKGKLVDSDDLLATDQCSCVSS